MVTTTVVSPSSSTEFPWSTRLWNPTPGGRRFERASRGLQFATDASPGFWNPDKNNIEPRAGFAYQLTDKMVVRGGYGIFYPTSAAQGVRDPMASAPFNPDIALSITAT